MGGAGGCGECAGDGVGGVAGGERRVAGGEVGGVERVG